MIFGKNCIFFEKFVSEYATNRLKYGQSGCFRGAEGAAKNLVFRKNFQHPPPWAPPGKIFQIRPWAQHPNFPKFLVAATGWSAV